MSSMLYILKCEGAIIEYLEVLRVRYVTHFKV